MENFDEIVSDFWEKRNKGIWRISTEIIQLGNDRWIKATIFYSRWAIVTAHSEDFALGKLENAEKQAISRAIKLLPPTIYSLGVASTNDW